MFPHHNNYTLLYYVSHLLLMHNGVNKYILYRSKLFQIHNCAYGVGYLLMYGAILVKMWRVYQIFHNKSPEIGVSI